jgi:hypothetical protein
MLKGLIQDLKEKECTNCNSIKKLDEYHFRINKTTQTKYYQSFCKKCQNRYDYNNDKNFKLKKAYGITLDQYNELLSSQNHKCAICYTESNRKYRGKIKAFAVDHCHTTGTIRGLLCNDCNTGIGLLKDNVIFLESAINYLNKSRN